MSDFRYDLLLRGQLHLDQGESQIQIPRGIHYLEKGCEPLIKKNKAQGPHVYVLYYK